MTAEFNSAQFEKRLSILKDSQESINTCCHWCLENRQHHKKIVASWFNVLKRSKVEQRLTLFYLANDVIQYSKRKNYDFVESWVTTLQKATTMVRDEKVKHKILRIFKIWEQRGVYGEEFISDLCGLISASPKKNDEPTEFQLSYLVQKIKNCSNLESDTDLKLKQLKEHNPKIQIDTESLVTNLKDRAHVDDVEKELDDYTRHIECYVNALKTEIKARSHLISILQQAQTQLETERKDVKVVANAYKTFGTRVKSVKKKLDEVIPTLPSPIPSPDINAPSPSPDSDIELPVTEATSQAGSESTFNNTTIFTNAGYYNPVPLSSTEETSNVQNNNFSSFMGTNNPFNLQNFNTSSLFNNSQDALPALSTNSTSQKMLVDNYNLKNVYPDVSNPPPKPVAPPSTNYQYDSTSTPMPVLPPPPMPPFSKHNESYGNSTTYTDSYRTSGYTNSADMDYQMSANSSNSTTTPTFETMATSYDKPVFSHNTTPVYQQSSADPSYNSTYEISTANYESSHTGYNSQPPYLSPNKNFQNSNAHFDLLDSTPFANPPNPNPFNNHSLPPPTTNISVPQVQPFSQNEEYNPEEEPETWEPEPTWEQIPPVELDTPESPPLYEKEGYGDPIEYHDGQSLNTQDVDHRVLPVLASEPPPKEMKLGHRNKDVDHRNLISLTGSPGESSNSQTMDNSLWPSKDQDYRKSTGSTRDQDYRSDFNIVNLKLPPPPPPPAKNVPTVINNFNKKSPRKAQDNNESIDMDLSDDEHHISEHGNSKLDSVAVETETDSSSNSTKKEQQNEEALEPPPPFPDLADDADANNFLDSLNNDLNCGEFETDKPSDENNKQTEEDFPNLMFNNGPQFCQNRWNIPAPNMAQPMNIHGIVPEGMNVPMPMPPNGWNEQEFPIDGHFGFRGRGRIKNHFGNRGGRGNWMGNNFRGNENNFRDSSGDFKGGGSDFRGRLKSWGLARGQNFRGGRGMMRGPINRGFIRGVRGRGNFRGNFRGGF